jgi:hypothetical protein
LRIIDAEYLNRCPANRRPADQQRPCPLKTALPMVSAGVEQLHELARLRVDTCEIWPLEAITIKARQTSVLRDHRAAVFPGDDVVNLEGKQGLRLCQLAVFAPRVRPLPDKLDERLFHPALSVRAFSD